MAGRAGHVEAAVDLVEHDVVGVGLERVGGQLPGLVDEADRRLVHGRAAELQRARAHGALAALDEVGVAVHEADALHRDAELVAGEGGERGGVALPVRRAAGVDGGRAVGLHLDLGELLAGLRTGGDLHVERHADAELHGLAGVAGGGPARRAAPS